MAVVSIASAALLYCARRPLLRAVAAPLVTNDEERSCDAIVLLNGNISTRPYRAVQLYESCRVPILMARVADTEEVRLGLIPNISETTVRLLVRLGVARRDVDFRSSDRWVAGTWDEAVLLCARIRAHGYRSVAIVTDAFHSRRARWTFRKVMNDADVDFFCVTTEFSRRQAEFWWRSESGHIQVLMEYIKFLHYRWHLRERMRRIPPRESDLPPADETRRLVAGYIPRDPGSTDCRNRC
ncbi:MAG: YdcF family protein [Arenicellales bacterium]